MVRSISGRIILAAMVVLIPGFVSAQISSGGIPYSFNNSHLVDKIDTRLMPAVDVEALLAEDVIEEEQGLPFRFGAGFEVDYNLYNAGTWDELPDGSGLWRLKIVSEGAYSINLLYSQFYMPEGGKFFVYSEDKEMVLGAFTKQNNKEYNKFATAPVKGDVIILEYYEPVEMRGVGEITVSRVVHGYKDVFNFGGTKWEKDFGQSGACNNNVNCPEGEPWQDQKRAVGMILLDDGTRFCTGALVNNVLQDGTPYFLTANHCLYGDPASWLVMLNYESPTCENIEGPTDQTVQGLTLRATRTISDFALLEISEQPPDSYYVYYAGWSNENIASQQSTAIHHPSCDIKKISFDYDSVTTAGFLSETGVTHWRVGNWEDGTTEPGSSGSPLFDQNHRIVGQLSGGEASCDSILSDWYGKFSVSWNDGILPSSRLREWLDPYNTGVTAIDGYDPNDRIFIIHDPLPNTRDTVNDYEVAAVITSTEPLIPDSLKLHYWISTVWYHELMTATGNEDEFHAFIPAQSAGTTISYFLTAWDAAGRTDTSETYLFFIEYSPAIAVNPITFDYTLPQGDSASDVIVIENVGQGLLQYNISVDFSPYEKGFMKETNGSGGPDSFGYCWVDSDEPGGPVFNWVDVSATGDDIVGNLENNNCDGPFDIGFGFPYYGRVYNRFYLGSNGIIGFDTANMSAHIGTMFPDSSVPNNILAWLWDNLDPTPIMNPDAHVYHEFNDSQCIIQFQNYPEHWELNKEVEGGIFGGVVDAEVILQSNGNIKYQYLSFSLDFDILSCAVGIENIDGTDGLTIAFHTSYLKDSLAVLFDSPVHWLRLSNYGGFLYGAEADTIDCGIYTDALDTGSYVAEIIIKSNDPDPADTIQTIPVDLTVLAGPIYICGDVNSDETVNILDITALISFLYMQGPAPDPLEAADASGDGAINILDITYLIAFLYKGGPEPICL